MGDLVLTIVIAVIASGVFSGLGVAIFSAYKNRGHRDDNAWNQRDSYRSQADDLYATLQTHRHLCFEKHGMAFIDMPRTREERRNAKNASD